MSRADYWICPICDQKAFYDDSQSEYAQRPDAEVIHTACLERDRAERATAVREQVAQDIEALRRDHDRWPLDAQDGFLDWHHGLDSAAAIARGSAADGGEGRG